MNQSNVIDFFSAALRILRFDCTNNAIQKRAHLNRALSNCNRLLTQERKKQTQTKKEVSNGTN